MPVDILGHEIEQHLSTTPTEEFEHWSRINIPPSRIDECQRKATLTRGGDVMEIVFERPGKHMDLKCFLLLSIMSLLQNS